LPSSLQRRGHRDVMSPLFWRPQRAPAAVSIPVWRWSVTPGGYRGLGRLHPPARLTTPDGKDALVASATGWSIVDVPDQSRPAADRPAPHSDEKPLGARGNIAITRSTVIGAFPSVRARPEHRRQCKHSRKHRSSALIKLLPRRATPDGDLDTRDATLVRTPWPAGNTPDSSAVRWRTHVWWCCRR
jgi:hypothetical protein